MLVAQSRDCSGQCEPPVDMSITEPSLGGASDDISSSANSCNQTQGEMPAQSLSGPAKGHLNHPEVLAVIVHA